MVKYVYNPFSGESPDSQWYNFVQNESYVTNVNDSIEKQAERMQEVIEHSSQAQIQSMSNSTSAIIGSVNQGFGRLSHQLAQGFNDVVGQVRSMSNTLRKGLENLEWQMSLSLEQQRINNILNQNIAALLRIPETQKERRYYIEQGLKFFANAKLNSDLIEDAIENLLKAEEIEKTDYFVLHHIGMIYLYGKKHIDVVKAEDYFCRAAKYAQVESHPDAITLIDILSLDVGQDFKTAENPKNKILALAAESYKQAGIACFIQRKLNKSIELFEKSYELNPKLDILFFKAKVLCTANEDQKAVLTLKDIYSKDESYIYKTISDYELITSSSVSQLLLDIRDENVNKVKKEIEYIDECLLQFDDNQIKEIVENIKQLIEKNTYKDAQEALHELSLLRDWQSPVYICSKPINIDESILVTPTYCYDDERKIKVITPVTKFTKENFVAERQDRLNKTLNALNLLGEKQVLVTGEKDLSTILLSRNKFETIKSIHILGDNFDDVFICGKKYDYKGEIRNEIERFKLNYEKGTVEKVKTYDFYSKRWDSDKYLCIGYINKTVVIAYITDNSGIAPSIWFVNAETGSNYSYDIVRIGKIDIPWMGFYNNKLYLNEEGYANIIKLEIVPNLIKCTKYANMETCLDLNLESVCSENCIFKCHSDVLNASISENNLLIKHKRFIVKDYCTYKVNEITKIYKVKHFINTQKLKFDEQVEKERIEAELKEEQRLKPFFEQAKSLGNEGFIEETKNDQKRFFKNYNRSLELYTEALQICEKSNMPSNKYYVYTDQSTGLPIYFENTIPMGKKNNALECDIMERLIKDIERVKGKIKN